jgi:hypothetical protein
VSVNARRLRPASTGPRVRSRLTRKAGHHNYNALQFRRTEPAAQRGAMAAGPAAPVLSRSSPIALGVQGKERQNRVELACSNSTSLRPVRAIGCITTSPPARSPTSALRCHSRGRRSITHSSASRRVSRAAPLPCESRIHWPVTKDRLRGGREKYDATGLTLRASRDPLAQRHASFGCCTFPSGKWQCVIESLRDRR